MLNPSRDVLLLDGDCGLCHRLARFMDPRLVPGADIAYRPIQSEEAQGLISTLPEWQQRAATVYLFRDGNSYVRSAAVIRCLFYMRWHWRVWFPLLWMIPLPIRDLVYRLVSRYRHLVFERPEVCTFRID